VTLENLRKKVWWWRRNEIRRRGVPGVVWDAHAKEAARNYELMRRSPGAKQFKKTYLELNANERGLIHCLWSNWPAPVYRFATDKSQFNEKGWTPVLENPPTQWNLRLADKILVSEFKRQITTARAIQRIRPRHALKGKKHRGVSWKYIEILDRQRHGLGTFSASERHMASFGRKAAARLLKVFKAALTLSVESIRQDHQTVPRKAGTWARPAHPVPIEAFNAETEIVQVCEYFNFQIIDSWQ
jgi:hypothetical protein